MVDPYTRTCSMKRQNIIAVYDLCRAYIAPKAAREADLSAYQDMPIGSGPYQIVNWAKGDRVTLQAFPDYWRGVAVPATLIFRNIPDTQTALAELTSGGVDLVRNVDYILTQYLRRTQTWRSHR